MLLDLVDTLAPTGPNPNRQEREITESTLLVVVPETVGSRRSVQEPSVRASIDESGAGRSSMSSLRNSRFDKIKIGCSVVQAIIGDPTSGTVDPRPTSKVSVSTTAEGVETSAQFDYISANGCTEAQGFLFAKPMARAAERDFIRQNI